MANINELKVGDWVMTIPEWNGGKAIRGFLVRVGKVYCERFQDCSVIVPGKSPTWYYFGCDSLTKVEGPKIEVSKKVERVDSYVFVAYKWHERGKDRVILTAGCRIHSGLQSAFNRWKPEYRMNDVGPEHKGWRQERKKLNAESRTIVKAIAKQLNLPAPTRAPTSRTKPAAKTVQSSRRSASASPARRKRKKSK